MKTLITFIACAFSLVAADEKEERQKPKEMTVEQKLDVSKRMTTIRRIQLSIAQLQAATEKAGGEMNKVSSEFQSLKDKLVADGFAPKCEDSKTVPELTEDITWTCVPK